jgi:hypothetical protein
MKFDEICAVVGYYAASQRCIMSQKGAELINITVEA